MVVFCRHDSVILHYSSSILTHGHLLALSHCRRVIVVMCRHNPDYPSLFLIHPDPWSSFVGIIPLSSCHCRHMSAKCVEIVDVGRIQGKKRRRKEKRGRGGGELLYPAWVRSRDQLPRQQHIHHDDDANDNRTTSIHGNA
jgi:hypothetical protein